MIAVALSTNVLGCNPTRPRPIEQHAYPRVSHSVLVNDQQGSGHHRDDKRHFQMNVESQLSRNPLRAIYQNEMPQIDPIRRSVRT